VRRDRGRVADTTAETAAGDALGDALLVSVLSSIKDKRERALLFAHVGLDLPLSALARTLELDRRTLTETVAAVLERLRSDEELIARLGDVRRAGRAEHYLMLAERLDLQDWFCANCRKFMAQPALGRPRRTCSDACRQALCRSEDQGRWDTAYGIARTYRERRGTEGRSSVFQRPPNLRVTASESEAMRVALSRVVRNLDAALELRMTPSDVNNMEKAMILLGFSCPVQLSPMHLVALTMADVNDTPQGLEVRLHWGKQRVRQYVAVARDQNAALCPVRAMRTWRAWLRQLPGQLPRNRLDPLFFEVDRQGQLNIDAPLSGSKAAALIKATLDSAGLRTPYLSLDDLLPSYLKGVTSGRPSSLPKR
jgi:hypothetical protein